MSDGITDKRGQTPMYLTEAENQALARDRKAAEEMEQALAFMEREDSRTPHWRTLISGYETLADVLDEALQDVVAGKGRDRHGLAARLDDQPVMQIGAMVGPGHALGQVLKKVQEAALLHQRGEDAQARRELLGAIAYCGFAAILIDRKASAF